MRKLYDAHPCGERALFLKSSTEKRLKKSLTYLFDVVQDVTPDLVDHLKSKLQSLRKLPLLPGFYNLINSYLVKYAEQEQIEQLRQLVKAIIHLDYSHRSLDILKYQDVKIPAFLWSLFDEVSLYDLPTGSKNYPLDESGFHCAKNNILESIAILEETCCDLASEIAILVKEIVILESNRVIAGSSFDLLGLIYIKANPDLHIIDYLDFLVHEAAHQYIFNVSSMDSLCLNDPNEKYKSPLRADPRPLMGIYHATFVTARLIYLFKNLEKFGRETSFERLPKENIREKITHYEKKYFLGLETTLQHGQLTPIGRDLITSTEQLII